jgi:predicted Zn-dependent peptidase
MFHKQQIRENFNLYHKASTQFKDNTLVFRFLFPMTQTNLDLAQVYSQCLDDRSSFAPTKVDMIRWMDDLYDASFGSYITTYGQSFALSVVFKGIEGKFVNDDVQNDAFVAWAMKILDGVLLNEDTLKEAKLNVLQSIKREQENHVKYALALSAQRFEHSPYALKVDGSEDVALITLDDIKKFHHSMISAPLDVFQVGQLSVACCLNALEHSRFAQAKVSIPTYTSLSSLPLPKASVTKQSPQTIYIKTYATHVDYASEKYLAYRLGAIAFGNLPSSLLFTTLREKHSLCYFVHASLIAFDGVMNIVTGIEKENIEQVSKLIDEQWEAFNTVDEKLIHQAKLMMINSLTSSDDDVMSSINLVYSSSLKNEVFDLEKTQKKIMSITKEEIIEALQTSQLVSEFVLIGEHHV